MLPDSTSHDKAAVIKTGGVGKTDKTQWGRTDQKQTHTNRRQLIFVNSERMVFSTHGAEQLDIHIPKRKKNT